MNLYWIRHKDHTDIFSQGYVGVSNNVKKRWYDHKTYTENNHLKNAIAKYGWDNLVKKVVLIADDAYCLEIESKLRPTDKLGWNVIKGGGLPPSTKGKKIGAMSEKHKFNISKAKKGFKHTPETEALVTQNLLKYGVKTRFKKGEVPLVNKIKYVCQHCGKNGKGVVMKRWHFDNCKLKEKSCQA